MKKFLYFTQDYPIKERIILRDHLALQRTKLANERTLLTYVRSSLYLIIAGIAFLNVQEFENIPYLGIMCMVLSGILFIIGIIRYWQLHKQIQKVYKISFEQEKQPDLQ